MRMINELSFRPTGEILVSNECERSSRISPPTFAGVEMTIVEFT